MIFVTGANGYIGSYVVAELLARCDDRLALLIRASSIEEAHRRLWKALQLHMDFEAFHSHLNRFDIRLGDITSQKLGLSDEGFDQLADSVSSIIHIAASLNRRSDRVCFDVNLRGTMQVIKLARAAQDRNGLGRFSDVSTSAVAGHRQDETVQEDSAIGWDRSDYDPYARTKKFCEYMVSELLPDVPISVFRPTIVMGDSRFAETTQFDMVRAFAALARMHVIPLRPEWRQDIVPADYVGRAIAHVHLKDAPAHRIYHLSAGEDSLTSGEILEGLRFRGEPVRHRFAPVLGAPFGSVVGTLANTPRRFGVSGPASLLKVFWPYVTFNTVFDNRRIVEELGEAPVSFGRYASRLLDYAVDNDFSYAYREWPGDMEGASSAA